MIRFCGQKVKGQDPNMAKGPAGGGIHTADAGLLPQCTLQLNS